MDTNEQLISQREHSHGAFADNAAVAQGLKTVMRSSPHWNGLACEHREALELMATKIGRILAGNAMAEDHWRDMGGYAKLAELATRIDETRAAMPIGPLGALPPGTPAREVYSCSCGWSGYTPDRRPVSGELMCPTCRFRLAPHFQLPRKP